MSLCVKLSCASLVLLSATLGTGCAAREPVRWARQVRLIQDIGFDLEQALRDGRDGQPRAAEANLRRASALQGRELQLVAEAVDGQITDDEIEVPGGDGPQWVAVIRLPWEGPGADRAARQVTARRLAAAAQRIVALTGKKVALRVGRLTAIPGSDGIAIAGAPAEAPAALPSPQRVAAPSPIAAPAPARSRRPAPAAGEGREITAGCDSPSSC